jgi:predicted XRE-type DNA-binding protein
MAHDRRILALRLQLARAIVGTLGKSQVIATDFGISQPRMSELARDCVDRHTVEWLIRRVHAMGGTVTLSVELGDVRREWRRERFRAARDDG